MRGGGVNIEEGGMNNLHHKSQEPVEVGGVLTAYREQGLHAFQTTPIMDNVVPPSVTMTTY